MTNGRPPKDVRRTFEVCNPSVTGYGLRQREKRGYLTLGVVGEFVEEGFKNRFERVIPSAFIHGVKNGH
jgi:hypothetical protein